MAIIDVNTMYAEMLSTMKNNFTGNIENRYESAKALFLENVSAVIDKNKKELIEELTEEFDTGDSQ